MKIINSRLQIAVIGLRVKTLSVHTPTNLYTINLNLGSAVSSGLSVSMATHQQNTPQKCWNRVTVAEVKIPVRPAVMETGWRVYVGWLRRMRVGYSNSYQGQPHRSHQQHLTWYDYMVQVISADETQEEERMQSSTDFKKSGRFRHMSGSWTSKTHLNLHKHTHTQRKLKDHNNTNRKDSPIHNLSVNPEHLSLSITALTRSKIHLIKIGSVQFCWNRISHQWRL